MANNPRAAKNLQRGNPGNKGGGRHPDWLKEKCKRLIDKKKIIERLAAIAGGDLVDTVNGVDGKILRVPAPITAQVKAAQELLDRGFGKSVQALEHSGSVDMNAEAAKKKIEQETRAYLQGILGGSSAL